MAQETDYDKKFQEDLERAQALSLESLALEKFKNKRLEELNKLSTTNKPKNVSVSRASSMTENHSMHSKQEIKQLKARPRPGTSATNQSHSLIAPPPSRKNSSSACSVDTPDLISFASPPTSTTNIIDFCNMQSYSNSGITYTPPVVQPSQYAYRFQSLEGKLSTFNSTPPLQQSMPWYPPLYSAQTALHHPTPVNFSSQPLTVAARMQPMPSSMGSLSSSSISSFPSQQPQALPQPLRSSSFDAGQLQAPALPPKNQHKTPPPIVLPSTVVNAQRRTKAANLIDLAQGDDSDKNSVRVSILQEFDPILCASDYASSSRAISPDCSGDDAMSVCGSVYDEYDPYDFIYTGSGNNSVADPMYAAIVKSENRNISQSPVPPLPPRMRLSTIERSNKHSKKTKCDLLDSITKVDYKISQAQDDDLMAFYNMVLNVRAQHRYNDPDTNMGLIISPMVNYRYKEDTSIKLIVYPDFEGSDYNKPISFTCDVTSSIEHVTLQLMCDLEAPSSNKYTLKVWRFNEYLAPTSLLSDYEYVHNCIKLEEDVVLTLIPDSKIDKSFARTLQDDTRDRNLSFEDVVPNDLVRSYLSYDNLIILLETVESEMKKLEEAALQIESSNSSKISALQPSKVVQTVKCVINLMGNLCTLEIIEAVDSLRKTCNNFSQVEGLSFPQDISITCNKIRLAIQNLIETYSQAFKVDFQVKNPIIPVESTTYVPDISDFLLLRICAVYRPSIEWKHDFYIIAAQIYHGTKPVKQPRLTPAYKKTEQDQFWPAHISFNYWIDFDDVPISSLARETRLVLVVYGRTLEPPESGDNSETPKYKQEEIGWASVQLFDYKGRLTCGSNLLSIWPRQSNYMYGPAPAPGTHPVADHPMLGLEIPQSPGIEFPPVSSELTFNAEKCDFSSLDNQTQQQLLEICEQDMLYKIEPDLRELLWDKRHYLYHIPDALPKVLLAAHSWEYSCLSDLHGMLHSWRHLKPLQALQLLLPTFPDIEVRKYAVKWISHLRNDALIDYLPQLVVALRNETYETSHLARFLLDRSLKSPRFAHYLFWLLSHSLPGSLPQNFNFVNEATERDAVTIAEVRYHRRMKLLLRALLAICGEALRNCFLSQQMLVKELNEVAERVQKTKESHRQTILQNSLEQIDANLRENETSLPLSPTLRVAGLDIRSCSYFPSNTLPLKIHFLAPDRSIIPAIYKIGDDLQQDMLTLQMVRIMDKLWLQQGLDLKMVTFDCIPTGKKKGMIEMVSKAETLRKIQVEHGLTGSFKDKPIAEWLAKHNPSELEYGRAVENFTASCAGYCVVTYILGICDRHNDNIMLKTSGHLFHIDFGKFLGDAQMFGNFKRDRAPFVLTSDMAYVINGGDRPSEKFHQFVDLCCHAFNIVRKHGNLFLYLFTLMMSSGICGVTTESVNYLHNALLPRMSNPEAAAYFARLIESSLKSWFTQFNFFLHNLAQLKFTAEHNEGSLLSFVPKTYSMETDGRLKHVEVVKYRKRYDPDKYYVYILRVYREDNGPPMELQRTFKEFCELHQKVCIYFPLAKLHSLSTGLHVGRSNIKQVAEKRYHEVCLFIKSLFQCAKEIAHSDLVYTFFHPLLRDQQCQEDYYKKAKNRLPKNETGMLKGQLKLSLQFSKDVFCVMVHHVRGLPLLANGQEPSTYVKVYLLPDVTKTTKRKTKVVKRNCHPSFMEMLEYRMTLEIVQQRTLRATVWNYDPLQENEFLGGVELDLTQFDLTNELTEWYPLVNLSR